MEYGFLSLVPPLLTIILALTTKNVFVSLIVGIMTGSFVLNAFSRSACMQETITSPQRATVLRAPVDDSGSGTRS